MSERYAGFNYGLDGGTPPPYPGEESWWGVLASSGRMGANGVHKWRPKRHRPQRNCWTRWGGGMPARGLEKNGRIWYCQRIKKPRNHILRPVSKKWTLSNNEECNQINIFIQFEHIWTNPTWILCVRISKLEDRKIFWYLSPGSWLHLGGFKSDRQPTWWAQRWMTAFRKTK